MLTFVNKLDLPARDPLELLDEIERVLGVAAVPMNWPIGTGDRFRGVYDLQRQQVLFYERAGGERRAPVSVSSADDPRLVALLGEERRAEFLESVHLLQAAGTRFDLDQYRAGRQTAVFFGSRCRTSASSRSSRHSSSSRRRRPRARATPGRSTRRRATSAGSSSRFRRT